MPVTEIDDCHPNATYSGGWGISGNGNEFQSTTHYTVYAGATMTVTFEGIAITVYGTTSPADRVAASSRYSIDGKVISTYNSPIVTQPGYHTEFFKSPALSNGKHLLLVENLTDGAPFFLDSFIITTADKDVSPQLESKANTSTTTKENTIAPSSSSPSPSPALPPLSPSPSPPPSSPSPSPPPTSLLPLPSPLQNSTLSAQRTTQIALGLTPLPTNTQSTTLQTTVPGPSPPNQVPTGAIVGATTASVSVIVIILCVIWRRRRRSKKYEELPRRSERTDNTLGITPFVGSEVPPRDHSPTDTRNYSRNNIFAWSTTPDRGRVTKSRHPGPSIPVANMPITHPLLEARTQSPPLDTRNEGGDLNYNRSIARDDLSPPSYHVV